MKYTYLNHKPTCTLYDPSVKLFQNIVDSVRQTAYERIIGSHRYATDCIRLDIVYVLGMLCRFTSTPSNEHWKTIERVVQCLIRTMNLDLHYQRFHVVFERYTYAYQKTLSDDSKANSGYIFNIVGAVVSWKSKKQTILAQPMMKS